GRTGRDRTRIISPQPTHRVGEQCRRMPTIVTALSPDVLYVVAGEHERSLHRLVGDPPISAINVQVVLAVLHEDADRLRLILANKSRIPIGSAQTDEGADCTEHALKGVGPLPRDRKSTHGAAARSTD